VFVDRSFIPSGFDESANIAPYLTADAWQSASQKLISLRDSGVDAVLIARVGAYMEFDAKDAIRRHREQGAAVTRAHDDQGPLDLWIVDPARFDAREDLLSALLAAAGAHYEVPGYVNRLEHPEDLRRLVVDSLTSRCAFRPQGTEVRPGVWMAEGAQVDRGARVVAPAFVGRSVRIAEQCLITRCSNVESNSYVDYGTVVEDSTILSNTYVGIGLDLSHSIVGGRSLVSLRRNVVLDIADPVVMRENKPRTEADRLRSTDFGFGEMALLSAEE
jgi:carbonic anhydrase/acetyltransferase-like protein (isoleucine patch superfamily)